MSGHARTGHSLLLFSQSVRLSNPRLRTPGVSPGVKASDAGKILNVGVVP